MEPSDRIAEKFKEHVARMLVDADDTKVLEFSKPKSSFYSLTFILHRGWLTVVGDCAASVYIFSKMDFDWIADSDFEYFVSKLVASPQGNEGKVWSEDVARKGMEEYVRQNSLMSWFGQAGTEDTFQDNPYEHLGSAFEWDSFLGGETARKIFGEEPWRELSGIGLTTDVIHMYHYWGLKAAMAQLKAGSKP